MRREDREIKDTDSILKIVSKCKVCRIAMLDKNKAYIVPLNYGYSYNDNTLLLFFHSALVGRKIDLLKNNPNVCFEMDCGHGLVTGDIACKYGYIFESIIGEGKITFIESEFEKSYALNQIMKHQTGIEKDFAFDDNTFRRTIAYKLTVDTISGKTKKL
jgi:nitroimidazol reductase NimA-like FMN-containing flavoprotein (pyridoxamine 5'-phosphate oxidase superfamily)